MVLNFIEKIGHGGFDSVDKVIDEHGNIYARKTFNINQGLDFPKHLEENVLRRFIREAKVQSAISHKNIVPVLGMDLKANPPFFLMPLAISSLHYDMQNDRTIGDNFLNAIMDIIAALEEIHAMEIYHRDLKPANVLRYAGNNGDKRDFYAIGDFGLMSVSQANLSPLTQSGMRIGADYYAAPEIVKGLKNATAQSDIFSLGCILHDFVGLDDRIPNNEIRENSEFGAILLSCTRRDPNRRFKSVTALRDAILSLGKVNILPVTSRGASVVDILSNTKLPILEEDWKTIIFFIEDNYDSKDSIAILARLTIGHIGHVTQYYPALANRLGIMYARWIREHSFDFAECDGLAIRLQQFVQNCSVDATSECLMAMLYLGIAHNRFFVKRKFADLIGKTLEENVAKRLAVEFRVDGDDVCVALNDISYSVDFPLAHLHPLLFQTIKQICK